MTALAGKRVLVTGANGFIGKQLIKRLLAADAADRPASLLLVDVTFDERPVDGIVCQMVGSAGDPDVLSAALAGTPDVIFHMAAVPGGASETNFELGYEVNLRSTVYLLEAIRRLCAAPVFVYTSSVGVFGDPPALVTDDTPPSPRWSYGAHKAACELLVADYSRKGWLDGRVIRLPGIVIRPAVKNGAITLFQSDILRELGAGRPMTCPVGPKATPWWMSARRCVDNLLTAAAATAPALRADRTYTLPLLRLAVGEIVEELARQRGTRIAGLITYAPQTAVEDRFGRLPPVLLPQAEAAGFRSDGSVAEFVSSALEMPS